MPKPEAQAVLAGIALCILGVLGVLLVLTALPQATAVILGTIVGAIGGALTMGAQGKLADKTTISTGANPVIQADASNPQQGNQQ